MITQEPKQDTHTVTSKEAKGNSATNTTVTQDCTQTESEPLIMQNLAIEEGTREEGIELLYNNVMIENEDKG